LLWGWPIGQKSPVLLGNFWQESDRSKEKAEGDAFKLKNLILFAIHVVFTALNHRSAGSACL
jgi:hypothetical protein